MIKKYILLFFIFISSFVDAQTTDLAIVVEAQNLSGNGVSQVQIYQEFQYLVTVINSGNSVSNTTFSQNINQNVTVLSAVSLNNIGGASAATGFNVVNNLLTGSVVNLPSNSSVQIKVSVIAPTTIGGIATTASVFPPQGTQDIDINNNQSIISIDVIDVAIDFSVVYSQVTPPQGTGISMWNDEVTYEFTITNNSAISYPLTGFIGISNLLTPPINGRPIVQLTSIDCLGGTNGTSCPDMSGITSNPVIVSSTQDIFSFGTPHSFTSGGSLTFRIVYKYLNPLCAFELQPIDVSSFVRLTLDHVNVSSNDSNNVSTNLLTAELCQITDICIETIQTNPTPNTLVDWEEEVTFTTTVCNNGPLDAPMIFFLQNLSVNIEWDIMSLTCVGSTGTIDCSEITLSEQNNVWSSNIFMMPAGATITVETVVVFLEPECSTNTTNAIVHVRTGSNLQSSEIIDSNILNNAESDYVTLPQTDLCASSDLQITKTQISPALPEGSLANNTTDWGSVTYEITVLNQSDIDTVIELSDYMPSGNANSFVSGSLTSVDCVSTTGTAACFNINHANIGVLLDGVPQQGMLDVFWEILPEDNWQLPAQSSVTFEVVVEWSPECTPLNIIATNEVMVNHVGTVIDNDDFNNKATVVTYFAPCVDLIVQTFPQFLQVSTNQNFDWIVDITNSSTSSNAVDIFVEDILSPTFTIVGTPTCQITSGSATCISTFSVNGNSVTGIIPNMEAGSTVRIRIPVSAPPFGGAFSNRAEAIPSETDNEELTPETNISISNVQVIAPTLMKNFTPDVIVVGEESTLTFNITNIASNPSQNGISFTDNLPAGISLAGSPSWVDSNGCTASFVGVDGDVSVGVINLNFPSGVANCSFSVAVTSTLEGVYINENENFSNKNNIDTSQVSATLTVTPDLRDVDIAVRKEVFPEEVAIGAEVDFAITITNLGSTDATLISIFEPLPSGYIYLSSSATTGNYDLTTSLWNINNLTANEMAVLTIRARVVGTDLLNTAMLQHLNEPDGNNNNNEDSAEVILNNCLEVPQGFSPTNDGLNDFFVIACIEDYDNNNIKIFNRLGVQVYESINYKNDWDGTANMGLLKSSKRLPVGTYFYIVEIEGLPKPIIGWVYLNY